MCIYYIGLNWLVDGVVGHKLLSFLNAYSGYNQIKMDPMDEKKMTFIAEFTKLLLQSHAIQT